MIIFGTRARTLVPKENKSYDCDYCQTKGSVTFAFIARYFHIFWIPIFPISKKGISQCSHCKQVLYEKEMSPRMKQDYANASASAKRPITHYFGLFIIGLIFCTVIYGITTNSINESKYLAEPKVNDVYEIEKNGSYTLYKISEVKGDTLIFKPHNMMAEKYTKLSELQKKHKNDYSEETIKFTKAQINSMKESAKSDFGKIYSIERE